MDTIEFRSMNSSIQAEANAAFVQPTQAYTKNNHSCGKACDGGAYGSGCARSGHDNNERGCSGEHGCYENGISIVNNGSGYDKDKDGRRCGGCETRNGNHNENHNENYNGNYNGNCNSNNGSQHARNGHIYYNGCEEIKVNEMDDKDIEGTGRIMDVTMTLKNVCPCRRVSVGYMVTEMDEENNEHSCGFKCFTVPAHYNSECCDVEVERTRFILPDDARVDGCTGHCSGRRHFIVRAEAHYADSNVTMP